LEDLEEEAMERVETNIPKKRHAKRVAPVVESEVRRSPRLKEVCNNFKSNACLNRKCLSCNPDPPILSFKVIKKIGVDFCKVDKELLSEEALLTKRKKQKPVTKEKMNEVEELENGIQGVGDEANKQEDGNDKPIDAEAEGNA
jgi:altronate dehydratase